MHTDLLHACRAAVDTGEFGRDAEPVYPPDLSLEPVHLDLDLAVDLDAQTLSGTVTHHLRSRHADARRVELHGLDLQDLSVRDPDGHAVEWTYDGARLTAWWREAIPAGERRRLAVTYRVVRPRSGLLFSKPGDPWPDGPTFAGTDHETERARHWLPVLDLPSARTTLDFHLRAKAGYEVLANGARVGQTEHDDGTRTVHWRLEQRCPSYILAFLVGDLVRVDHGEVDGVPVAYFTAAPFTADDLTRTLGRTPDLLRWMTGKLGRPFPFPKYFQFALPEFNGAMENISLVSWDDRFLLDPALATELGPRVDSVNCHEMAHSWFGDLVVVRDFAHAWLKESWATYMEQCWMEDVLGEDEALHTFWQNVQAYLSEADERYKRPLVTRRFNSSWEMFDRHLYPGGAARLHTLRRELGDEAFWSGVRAYLGRHAEGTVETGDFRRALEEASGRSLVRFFDQWFMSPGYPDLKVAFSWDGAARLGRFEIEQRQPDEKAGVPVFHLSTEVGWTIDGREHRQPVELTERRHVILVPMDRDPEQVRFDPGARVLHKLDFHPGDARLQAQLRGAPDVIGRIHAARTLAGTGKRENVEAVARAYAAEPFHGVRAEMARALGRAGTDAALVALRDVVAREEDARVLPAVMEAAGQYRDPELAQAVRRRLERGDLAPMAAGNAYRALGAQREQAPVDVLRAGADRPGRGGFAQAGAFEGLAATRRAELLSVLRQAAVDPGTPKWARPFALKALGDLAARGERPHREAARDTLVDLLRDPSGNVRKAAAAALGELHDRAALPALEAYRATLPHQDQVILDRTLHRLRTEPEPKAAALEKSLEVLQERHRKLEARLMELEARLAAGPPRGGAA